MDALVIIIALIVFAGVPAFIAYLIALFTYIKLVKAGNNHAKRNRIIVFIVSFIILLVSTAVLVISNLSFER